MGAEKETEFLCVASPEFKGTESAGGKGALLPSDPG